MESVESSRKFLALMKRLGYTPTRTIIQAYTKAGQYAESNCFEIGFVNKGTINARVNGYPLAPSESVSFPVSDKQYDVSKYKVDFDTGVGTRLVFSIRKVPSEI